MYIVILFYLWHMLTIVLIVIYYLSLNYCFISFCVYLTLNKPNIYLYISIYIILKINFDQIKQYVYQYIICYKNLYIINIF